MEIGQKAAVFSLSDENGQIWNLAEQLGKVTVLLFYPKNETLVCTRQLCSVRDHWKEYVTTNAEVVGISTAPTSGNKHFIEKYDLTIRLLTDEKRFITRLYSHNRFLPVSLTRAVVIIDAKGVIRYRQILPRIFRPSDKTILSVIFALKTEAVYERVQLREQRF